MKFVEYFFKKYLKYVFINKFSYSSLKNLFKLKKIVLIFKSEISNLKMIGTQLLFIELIVGKKGKFIVSKKQNVVLKIKSGSPTGCKIILSNKFMFKFLKKYIFGVFLLKKNLNIIKMIENKNYILLCLDHVAIFFNLKKFYIIFNKIKKLNLIIVFKNLKIKIF